MKPLFRPTRLMVLAAAVVGSAASAGETLGAWDHWAAFRSAEMGRCHAVSAPVATSRGGGGKAFLAVASWPAAGIRARLHARLSRAPRSGEPVRLAIGARWAQLTGEGRDAWTRGDADRAIIAAMRQGEVLKIDSRDAGGRVFADVYRLGGAASAIDAAAIACTAR